MSYSVSVINSIKDISAKEWDALEVSTSSEHSWHRLVEESAIITVKPRHILVRKEGVLIAFAATYIQHDALGVNVEESLYGRYVVLAHVLGLRLNPCLLCYSPMTVTGKSLIFRKKISPDEKITAFKLLRNKMECLAKQEGVRSFGFMNVCVDGTLVETPSNFIDVVPCSEVCIDVHWKSFDEYLASFPKVKRKKMKKELKVNEEHGLRTTVLSTPGRHAKRLCELFNSTYEKYRPEKGWFSEEYLQLVENCFGKRALYFVTKRDNDLLSAGLYIKGKNELFGYRLGTDCSCPDKLFCTFETAIYSPIRYAIKNNLRHIWLGTGSYDYKERRGGHKTPVHLSLCTTRFRPHLRFALRFVDSIKRQRHTE